ncbi:integrase core domain-containing protein [Saccharopolyspora shandongensis]|uniref:integrase core domain-containing protein n=1 Tax=Saccharopolyspora shandongensis TaxID=418495 RepID=UPI0034476100
MHLWQLDLVGGVFLADGRECKILTAIDDHSRFVVAATVLERPTGGAVVEAFTAAIRHYGVPFEVLTDNGKQFTGRFTRPVPAEVLFERTCREYGVTHRLTKRRSRTTTGKIERWHQTLRRELLDEAGEFADIHAAQDALDAWIQSYNHDRPHQSLDMATPASLFRPRLRQTNTAVDQERPAPVDTADVELQGPSPITPPTAPAASNTALHNAVEIDVIVPTSDQPVWSDISNCGWASTSSAGSSPSGPTIAAFTSSSTATTSRPSPPACPTRTSSSW